MSPPEPGHEGGSAPEPPGIAARPGAPPGDAPIRSILSDEAAQGLARLARLELTPDEIARISRDLEGILGYVAQLAELDLRDVEPTAHVQLERLALRPDVPSASFPQEVALAEAPETALGGFSVPAFVDEG